MTDYEKFSKGFLAGWLDTLMKSLKENLDDETRARVLASCGSFCAKAHASEIFKQLKKESKDFDDFLKLVNEKIKGTYWEKTAEDSLQITYEQCFCPIVALEIVKDSTQCDCSVGWLKENLEQTLEKPVKVTLQESVLRGGKSCKFIVKLKNSNEPL